MICHICKKEISPEEARHCTSCGRDYCSECADALCECAGEIRYYC